jgi:hypothetical protein
MQNWMLYNDHVDGVRLRLWTAATNGPTVHPPGDDYKHGEPWWNNANRGKLMIYPPELSGNPTNSHLVASKEDGLKEW